MSLRPLTHHQIQPPWELKFYIRHNIFGIAQKRILRVPDWHGFLISFPFRGNVSAPTIGPVEVCDYRQLLFGNMALLLRTGHSDWANGQHLTHPGPSHFLPPYVNDSTEDRLNYRRSLEEPEDGFLTVCLDPV